MAQKPGEWTTTLIGRFDEQVCQFGLNERIKNIDIF